MYSLDPACDDASGDVRDVACNRTAHIVWQAEFPLQLDGEDYYDVLATDLYNYCGGSIAKLPSGSSRR